MYKGHFNRESCQTIGTRIPFHQQKVVRKENYTINPWQTE